MNAIDPRAYVMSERQLQDSVRKKCRDLGLVVRHVRDERGNWVQGWPDLEILGSRLIFRELKAQGGRLTPEQRDVGDMLLRAGQDWAEWRPRHLLDGTIARELEAIR